MQSAMAPLVERVHHDIYPFIDPSQSLKNSAQGKSVLVTGGSRGIGKVCSPGELLLPRFHEQHGIKL